MQPKCPSTEEWIKKMWHIYTMEYYSAIKRNEIELFVVRQMDLESCHTEWSKSEREKQIPYARDMSFLSVHFNFTMSVSDSLSNNF